MPGLRTSPYIGLPAPCRNPGTKRSASERLWSGAPQSDSRLPRLPDGSPTRFSLSRDSGTRVDRQMSSTPKATRLISVIAGLQFQPVIHTRRAHAAGYAADLEG